MTEVPGAVRGITGWIDCAATGPDPTNPSVNAKVA